MSTLISSFIIEPVVRQARRFSGVVPNPEHSGDSPRRLSHATTDLRPSTTPTPTIDRDENAPSTTSSQGADSSRTNVDTFRRRYSDFIRHTPSASGPANAAPQVERSGEDDATPAAHSSERSLSDIPATTAPLPFAPSADAGMSENPNLDIPQRLRELSLDAGSTRPSTTVAIATNIQGGRSRAGTASSGHDGQNMSASLPADDGMRHLRAKIHQIRDMKVSSVEQARLMHSLMTERYHFLRPLPQSPLSIVSNDRPYTPTSGPSVPDSEFHLSSPISIAEIDPKNPHNLSPGDTDPTYRPQRLDITGEHEDAEALEEEPAFGCQHYKRNVKVQCFECRRWYTCRNCHDAVESHDLDRTKTQNMLCMACGTPQPAGDTCVQCGTEAAWYYCDICKLWDDDTNKNIYHCDDCGICRKGQGLGKDYIHCKRCDVCISIAFADSHRCVEQATHRDCPICGEYLFTSSTNVVSMPCGHYLHQVCYDLYMETAYKCPICKKSAVNMQLQWQKLSHAIESQPMPEQFADSRVIIHCNDCSAKSSVQYHWLGNKCNTCGSYNTNDLRLFTGPESEQTANAVMSSESNQLSPGSGATPSATSPLIGPSRPEPPRSPGSYFLQESEDRARSAEQGTGFPYPSFPYPNIPNMPNIPYPSIPWEMLERVRSFSPSTELQDTLPYQMFERVSRSLSPYIGEQASAAQGHAVQLRAQMLERVSRGLSPLRNYLNQSNADVPNQDLNGDQSDQPMDFWGADGWFLSGGEDDGDYEESESESDSDESMIDEDQDAEDDDDEEDELELFGHH